MLVAMTMGVLFEIFESYIGMVLIKERKIDGSIYSKWFEGTLMDLFFNFTGFVAGMLTTKYVLNGKPPKVPWISG